MGQGLARGTKIRIISGSRRGQTGTVDATVFGKSVDYPDDYAMGFQVTLDDGTWVTLRRERVGKLPSMNLPLEIRQTLSC